MGNQSSAGVDGAAREHASSGQPLDEQLGAGVPHEIQWLVARKLRLLSQADGVLLLARHGERAFSTDADDLVAPNAISPALAAAALQFDPHLQGVRDRLVRPRAKIDARRRAAGSASALSQHATLSDLTFWGNYFSHVDAIKHECTLDYFRALQALHNRNTKLRERWVALWLELDEAERCQLRRAADGIAWRAAQLESESGATADGADDDALGEYGERGAYEVVRVVLAAALGRGWRVSGPAEESRAGSGAGAGATAAGAEGADSSSFEELLYRVWCCSSALVPPTDVGAVASPAHPHLRSERSAEWLLGAAGGGARSAHASTPPPAQVAHAAERQSDGSSGPRPGSPRTPASSTHGGGPSRRAADEGVATHTVRT